MYYCFNFLAMMFGTTTYKTVLGSTYQIQCASVKDRMEEVSSQSNTLGLSGSRHFFDCPRKRFNRCFQGPLYEKDTKEIEMIPLANFEK